MEEKMAYSDRSYKVIIECNDYILMPFSSFVLIVKLPFL